MWSGSFGFPHPSFVIAAVHSSLLWDVLICLLLFGLSQATLFLCWCIRGAGVSLKDLHENLRTWGSEGSFESPEWREEGVGNRGALGKKVRMAVWQEGGAGTRLFVWPKVLFLAEGCSGCSSVPAWALPGQLGRVHHLPLPKELRDLGCVRSCLSGCPCQSYVWFGTDRACSQRAHWWSIISISYDKTDIMLRTIAFLIKHILHMIPFWCVPFFFV